MLGRCCTEEPPWPKPQELTVLPETLHLPWEGSLQWSVLVVGWMGCKITPTLYLNESNGGGAYCPRAGVLGCMHLSVF